MNNEIHESLGSQQFQHSIITQNALKKENKSDNEEFNEKIFNFQNNTTKTDLNFLNNENNILFAIKEVNITSGLCEIPKIVFNLKYLMILNLSNNSLKDLPKEIGNLCNLIVLNLSSNKLNCLPKTLKNVQQLNYLDISKNNFSKVPDVLYYGLRGLHELDLSFNQITNFNDFPGCLNKLLVLKISNNLLTELPVWVFDNLCQLQVLHLSENQLKFNTDFVNYCNTGIFNSLQLLNIENCGLNYENIPILEFFKNLNIIQMGNKTHSTKGNNYLGNFKCKLFKNMTKLKYLHFQSAQIATLPSDLDCLKNLEIIDLSDNIISWLPECFCNLINLKMINLTSNQLLFLPKDIDKLINLKQIHLSNNKLYCVPESLSNLKNLEFVDAYNNQIENIDENILKQLKGIDLGLNYLDFVGETRVLYNFKKDTFRNHFNDLGSRSDLQKLKSEKVSDEKYSDSSCFESESSDLEDPPVCMDERRYSEDEDWEDKNSTQFDEDELFDPNERFKFELRNNSWSTNFQDNYCPAKGHLPSVTKTYVRNFASFAKNETVEDGQFDSD